MLVDFTFENFKCYKDETVLSMQASGISEHADSLFDGLGNDELLPVTAIYGPNGGGKSSVIQAFECLWNLVTFPWLMMRSRTSLRSTLNWRPYSFDSKSAQMPTAFKIVFEKAGYQYRYILSVKDGEIIEEYLHRRKPKAGGVAAMLFERYDGTVRLGSSLKRRSISTRVDRQMPVLSFLAINYDLEAIDAAFEWLLGCCFLDYTEPRSEYRFYKVDDPEMRRRTVELLNNMDIDISDMRYRLSDEGEIDAIFLKHAKGGDSELELMEESNGTRKILSFLPAMIQALDRGSLVIADELDAKLHPKLLRYIIRLFTEKATNPNGAQLVFTSHDMYTLNSSTFRRDEIWFAAIGREGGSQLYSLADIVDTEGKRIRPQNAYDKQYLSGQYGADPYLRSMLAWKEHDVS